MSLPDTYLKLNWIASTGTQAIDTGIIPNPVTNYDIEVVAIKSDNSSLFGSGASSYVLTGNGTGTGKVPNYFYVGQTLTSPTEAGQIVGTIIQTDVHTWKIVDGVGYCDGIAATPERIGSAQPTTSIYLFARNTGSINDAGPAKMYSCKIWNNDTLVRNFIPCLRKSDLKPGLYDLVSNTFFINCAQTGPDFIYELDSYKTYLYLPDVPTGYTKLEYIQSTGTQYLDCGIKFDLTNQIDIGYEMTNPGGDQSMFAVGVQSSANNYAGHRTWDGGANQVFFINYGNRLSMPLSANTKYDVVFNRQPDHKVIVNNTELGTLGTNYINPNNNMFILAEDTVIQGVQQPWGKAKAKLYYFNMYDSNGTIIYNLIPAKRNSDGEIGMWDAAKQVFLTNQGDDEFIAGPEIIDDYIYVNYNTAIYYEGE